MLGIIKENKVKLILSNIIILLPVVVGLLLWGRLPERMPVHFDLDGTANGFRSKPFAVFVIPLAVLVLHWVSIIVTFSDKGNAGQNKRAMGTVFWISPVISLLIASVSYSSAFGVKVNSEFAIAGVISILFIVFGNYMPKIQKNSTLGIRTPWTVYDEENWSRTHRLGGKVWVACGFGMLMGMLFPGDVRVYLMLTAVVTAAVVPTVYSYVIYRRAKK